MFVFRLSIKALLDFNRGIAARQNGNPVECLLAMPDALVSRSFDFGDRKSLVA